MPAEYIVGVAFDVPLDSGSHDYPDAKRPDNLAIERFKATRLQRSTEMLEDGSRIECFANVIGSETVVDVFDKFGRRIAFGVRMPNDAVALRRHPDIDAQLRELLNYQCHPTSVWIIEMRKRIA